MPVALLASLLLQLPVQLPAELSQQEEQVLLRACSMTASPAVCVAGPPADDGLQARLEILGPQRYLLEVEIRSADHDHSTTRELVFSPEDRAEERARAAGLTLGLLLHTIVPASERSDVAAPTDAATAQGSGDASQPEDAQGGKEESEAHKPNAAPPDKTTRDERSAPTPRTPSVTAQDASRTGRSAPPVAAPPSPSLALGAAALLSLDPDLGSLEPGARVQSRLLLRSPVELVVRGDVRVAVGHAHRWNVVRGALDAGLAYRLELSNDFALIPSLSAGAELVAIELRQGAPVDQASRWSPTLSTGLTLRSHLSPNLVAEGGIELSWLLSPTEVVVDDTLEQSLGAWLPGLSLGLYWLPEGS